MRMRCDQALRQTVIANLDAFETNTHHDEGELRRAAVAVVVCDLAYGADVSGLANFDSYQQSAALLLTKRSSKLRRHAGQWALPGGRVDPGETIEEAAIREMREEVGLTLTANDIIGKLDDFTTRSGYVMSPIIFWAGTLPELSLNYDEVDSVHRIPVTEFERDDAPMLSESDHGDAPVLRMPIGDTWIAAPTAAILLQFREVCIRGKATRVSHFEQPKFAWK
ncbi:MAG: NUDIX hydrolase [Gammaproteobacteria bacterium]